MAAVNRNTNLKCGFLRNRRESELRESNYPGELSAIVRYLRERQEFCLWKERSRLEFYHTWSTPALEHPYKELNPKRECSSLLASIQDARSKRAKYTLSRYD